uniref:Ig-like domain-containing protein n=1 Tax=Cyprinus carpio TaxID=7962 RepID=A0A8C1YF01_CYPCA
MLVKVLICPAVTKTILVIYRIYNGTDITFCFTGYSFADTIQPLSSEKHIFRGDNVTLSCNYSGLVYDLQWYRNTGGSRPEFLILVNENSEASEHSLRLSAKDSKKQVNLTISSAEVTDSAVYYCALRGRSSLFCIPHAHNGLKTRPGR